MSHSKRNNPDDTINTNLCNLIIDSLPGIFYLFDQTGQMLRWNKRFESFTGYSPEEISKINALDFFRGTDRDRVAKRILEVFQIGHSSIEADFYTKNEIYKPLFLSGSRIEYDGRPCLIGMGIDISERKQAEEAQRNSALLLHAIQQISRIGGWEYDVEKETVTWMDETYRIHEIDPAKFSSQSNELINISLNCYPDEARVVIWNAFQCCVKDGKPYELELPFTTTEGKQLWVRTAGQPVYKDDRVVRVIGHIMDITEQKNSVLLLKESENKFKALFDNMFEFVGILNPEGVVVGANQTALNFAGIQESDVLGKFFWETKWWSHSKDLQTWLKEVIKKASSGEMVRCEVSNVDFNGKIIHLDFILKPVLDEEGKVLFLIPVARDISSKRQAEEALENERNKLKSIVDAIEYGLTIQDKDYNIIFQNLASRRFYPASHGEKCYKVYEQRDEICEGCPVKAAYEDGQSHTCERKSLLPSGEVAYWENTANLIRNSKGEITACLEVTRNITEHKRIGRLYVRKKNLLILLSILKWILFSYLKFLLDRLFVGTNLLRISQVILTRIFTE